MAVTATIKSKTLVIEVQTATDKAGDAIYGNKSFSGVKTNATDEAIFNVGQSIKSVLGVRSRNTFVQDVETLANA